MKDSNLASQQRFEDIYEPMAEDLRSIRSGGLAHQVTLEIEPMLAELSSLWPVMPEVAENGDSECPFAEDLYRRKEELEQKVAEKLGVLRDFRESMITDKRRCEKNLDRISVDKERLHHIEPRERFDEAFGRQEQEYLDVVRELQGIEGTIRRAEAVLADSRRRQYPGPAAGFPDVGGCQSPGDYIWDPRDEQFARRQVDDLISLGKMGSKDVGPVGTGT